MLTPDEAALRIADAIVPLDVVEVRLDSCDGLVLAENVISPISMPLWANSAMDGYACRAADIANVSEATPVRLQVIEDVRAGAFPSKAIGRGEATRIATGAPVPDGADTVVRVEDTDGGAAVVQVNLSRDAGRNVRPAGEDIRAGDVALEKGTALGPAQIALLASVGAAKVLTYRRPRVAIITTGDELVPLDRFSEVLAGKRIVSSNSYGLAAGVRSAGGEPVDFGIAPDVASDVRDVLLRATDCDLIITSAGVSVGEADHVKSAVTDLGGSVEFWRVQMRPGSPLAFGTIRDIPWIGLPGNPVSSLVTFELFARPAIRKLLGHRNVFAQRVTVVVDEAIALNGSLTHFLRVRLSPSVHGPARARLAGPQPSNILSSLARADALLIVPGDRREVRIGDELEAIPLGGIWAVNVDFDYKTLAIALFWLGGMVWLIKWIGRTIVEVSGGKPKSKESSEARLARLFQETGAASYLAEQRRGASVDPSRIAQHEREVLAQETALRTAAAAPIAPGTTPSLPHAGRMTGVAMLIHCPACGEPVNDVPTPLPFAAECPGCHRRINARGDGPQRMSVVVIEPRRPIES